MDVDISKAILMKFKLKQFEIDKDDPFGPSDILNRKAQGEALANLIQNVEPPFVIALNSPWGTGKTTFVHQMKQYLETQGQPCVYFNAWETDYHSDPIIAFTSEIVEILSNNVKSGTEQEENIKNIKETAGKISKRLLPVFVKFATRGAIDDAEMANLFGDSAAVATAELVAAHEKEKRLLKEFKNTLGAAIDNLKTNDKRLPLVVFVDELDRCRPTYAIELLERIKHIFDVENVVFVCSIEKRQLETSLSAVYGAETDSNEYLKRFFDFELFLRPPDLEAFVLYLAGQWRLDEISVNNQHQLRDTFVFFGGALNLSLRTFEQCFRTFVTSIQMARHQQGNFGILLASLIMLRAKEPSLYRRYVFGEQTGQEFWVEVCQKYPSLGQAKREVEFDFEVEFLIGKMRSTPTVNRDYHIVKEQMKQQTSLSMRLKEAGADRHGNGILNQIVDMIEFASP